MPTPHIDDYHFGQIVVDGQTYHKDVIILPDRVLSNWWRDQGHLLQPADLETIFEAEPQVLIVGQGAYGRMDVASETEQMLQSAKIKLIALPTKQACQTYNQVRSQGNVVAALHLTC